MIEQVLKYHKNIKFLIVIGYFLWWILWNAEYHTTQYHSNVAGGAALLVFHFWSVILSVVCYVLLIVVEKISKIREKSYKRLLFVPFLIEGLYIIFMIVKLELSE